MTLRILPRDMKEVCANSSTTNKSFICDRTLRSKKFGRSFPTEMPQFRSIVWKRIVAISPTKFPTDYSFGNYSDRIFDRRFGRKVQHISRALFRQRFIYSSEISSRAVFALSLVH